MRVGCVSYRKIFPLVIVMENPSGRASILKSVINVKGFFDEVRNPDLMSEEWENDHHRKSLSQRRNSFFFCCRTDLKWTHPFSCIG